MPTTTQNINYWFEVRKKAETCGLTVDIADMHFIVKYLGGGRLFENMSLCAVDNFLDGYIRGRENG